MKRRYARYLPLMMACTLMVACQATRQGEPDEAIAVPPEAASVAVESMRQDADIAGGLAVNKAARRAAVSDEAAQAQESSKDSHPSRKALDGVYLIRNASVNLRVKHLPSAVGRIRQLVTGRGGFVSESNEMVEEGRTPTAALTLRVPAERFDAVLNGLGRLTDADLLGKTTSSEDVSLEYVDTQSRVRNLKREEVQLLALLERSGKLNDILTVERELSRVRQEIEQAEGRVRQLSQQVALATITVSLTEQVLHTEHSPWQLTGVWQDAWVNAQRALAASVAVWVQRLVWFVLVWVPTTLPILFFYLLGGWLFGAIARRQLPRITVAQFRTVWAALGAVALGVYYPGVWVLIGAVFVATVAVWGGTRAWAWGRARARGLNDHGVESES